MKLKLTQTLLITALLVISTISQAANRAPKLQQMNCRSLDQPKEFSVTLDRATFTQGSKSIVPRNAMVTDNFFHSSRMTCIGSTAGDITCIGFVNGISDIIEVKTTSDLNGKVFASYEMIRGDGPSARDIECVIK
ncbi:MAG: hypothetical protein V4654_00520 [Bdellovibrionota bacterium]